MTIQEFDTLQNDLIAENVVFSVLVNPQTSTTKMGILFCDGETNFTNAKDYLDLNEIAYDTNDSHFSIVLLITF